MTKRNIAQIPSKLHQLLAPLTPEDRARVVQATLILFGEEMPDAPVQTDSEPSTRKSLTRRETPDQFISSKAPANKGELLAVAARYRELHENAETHAKADLQKVITDARRNFDSRNFARDMKNARRQAGFFNLGTGRDSDQLSYHGQQYVDALPDRERASALRRPSVGRAKKKRGKAK